jgi:hypothetical protein
VRVHQPGHDGEARAVDALAGLARGREPTLLNEDVGAGELPRADIDEPIAKRAQS